MFQAMRTFADELRDQGHNVHYFEIDSESNEQSFAKNITLLHQEHSYDIIQYQEPDEYRLDQLLAEELAEIGPTIEMVGSEHFYTTRSELKDMFEGKKQYLMETFYRQMRRKHDVLMEDGQPTTGKWNYDHENRKKLPKGHQPPEPKLFGRDVSRIVAQLDNAGVNTIGSIDDKSFIWPKNRDEALDMLDYFVQELLPNFGAYQDALTNDYWSVYHCRLSFSINLKILSPEEVVRTVESYWSEHQDEINIATVEGFIRQILGWREYMRGIYWAYMPDYEGMNYFDHETSLPQWYWTGDTKMNCLSKAIGQSLEYGYAHHIQRLMVTGNFALLAGIHPDEVDQWYLGIYVDAFQWVEITNTRGMSQFADGGIVGTKPYISSASYINKMGDHCKKCYYKHSVKTGDKACPFNSLYWNFLDRHRDRLSNNPRMGMMYRVWDKMDDSKQEELLIQADKYLTHLEEL
ncbi:MAG: cryptochrome/photolyase family protein [Bacteroidota bacterium]